MLRHWLCEHMLVNSALQHLKQKSINVGGTIAQKTKVFITQQP